MIVAKVFESSILKSLDRTLGFIFGIVEGGAVVALIIFQLNLNELSYCINIMIIKYSI